MNTVTLVAIAALAATLPVARVLAQGPAPAGQPSSAQPQTSDRMDVEREQKKAPNAAPDARQPDASSGTESASPRSPVDPAEAHKTGANVGDGASYNRSTETGQSNRPGQSN